VKVGNLKLKNLDVYNWNGMFLVNNICFIEMMLCTFGSLVNHLLSPSNCRDYWKGELKTFDCCMCLIVD